MFCYGVVICLFKQKTAYEMRISDWSSDVCSSDLPYREVVQLAPVVEMLGLLQLEAPGIVGGKNLPRRPGDDVVRPISQQRLPHRQSRDRLRRSALALPVRNAERVIAGPQPTALGDGLQSRQLHVLHRFAAFVLG